jgi:hypothetical protein
MSHTDAPALKVKTTVTPSFVHHVDILGQTCELSDIAHQLTRVLRGFAGAMENVHYVAVMKELGAVQDRFPRLHPESRPWLQPGPNARAVLCSLDEALKKSQEDEISIAARISSLLASDDDTPSFGPGMR